MQTVAIDNPVAETKKLLRCGRLREAQALCDAMLRKRKDWPEAIHLLGLIFAYSGQLDQSLGLLHRSAALRPDVLEFQVNLAQVLLRAGRVDEARTSVQIAVRDSAGGQPETLTILGDCLLKLGDLPDAEEAYQRALIRHPDFAPATCGVGRVLTAREDFEAAETTLSGLAARQPTYPGTYEALADLYQLWWDARELTKAYDRQLVLRPRDTKARSNMLFASCHDESQPRSILFHRHEEFEHHHPCKRAQNASTIFSNRPDPDRRLRIGYVSADLRCHTRGRFLEPLLTAHDREQFEIICYSSTRASDAITDRIRQHVDRWHDVSEFDDECVARMVRRDQVDILVELTGHMANNRLGVFLQRPAPLQVGYPGYPHSTGLSTIDYCLTDLDRAPPGIERFFTEKLYRLDRPSQCYLPFPADVEVVERPLDASTRITFGCFSRAIKISPTTAELWAGLLSKCPDARLLLVGPGARLSRHLTTALRRHGVRDEQVTLLPPRPPRDYMQLYNAIDISLDTFPYNGHSTTLDAAWMGVPTVTLRGASPASCVGAAVNRILGLSHLVTESGNDYVECALRLTRDPGQLRHLRRNLRQQMKCSPLGDGASLAQSIEKAYRDIWQRWCDEQRRHEMQG